MSASFNGKLLDSRQHSNSYNNLDATEDSDGDNGPICVPALISPPCSAGEDVDLSPPDIGTTSLDFDPMSFQCSVPDTTFAFPLDDSPVGVDSFVLKKSPGSICSNTNESDLISASLLGSFTSSLFTDCSLVDGEKAESKKQTSSSSQKPTQAVSPIKCGKATNLTPFTTLELFSSDTPDNAVQAVSSGQTVSSQPLASLASRDLPPLMGSMLLRAAEPSLSEAFQIKLHCKLGAFDTLETKYLSGEDSVQQTLAANHQEHQGKKQ